MFLISSEKILRVVLCSILDSLYSGHILTKNEGSSLPPWLLTLEAALRSAIATILPHGPFANYNRGPSHVSGAGDTAANSLGPVPSPEWTV